MIKKPLFFSIILTFLSIPCFATQPTHAQQYCPTPQSSAPQKLMRTACPDKDVQLLSIAPNADMYGQQESALEVASAGTYAQLKTQTLLGLAATRQNILNYLSCPNLLGVFFDGDGNQDLIGTTDGVITSDDFKTLFSGHFHYHTIFAFASANSFQEPLQNTMIHDIQAQKYIASNDAIYGGPADKTAACTMIALIENQNRDIDTSYLGCYQTFGQQDQWEVSGFGSKYFGK